MRKMKKILLAIVAFVLVLGLAACGGEETFTVNASDAAAKLRDGLVFQDELMEVSENNLSNLYGLSAEDVSEYKAYVSATMATAEEVAVFVAQDGKVDAVRQAVDARVQDQKENYQNYQPQEMTKLNSAIVRQKGNVVVLVVADDTETANTLVDEILK